jgi:aminopeptidase N
MPHFSHRIHLGAHAPAMFDPARFAPHYPPDLGLEPRHLDIDLQLDLGNTTAQGVVTTLVQAQRQGVQDLTLDAVGLLIASVEDGDGNALTWRADGQKLYVRWPQPFARGQQASVQVHYSVTDPATGLYFSRPTAADPEAPWYAVTDHETERARHWLPCIDLPNVRTSLDIRLRTASHFTVLANGYHVDNTDHGDGTKTTHYRLEQRCPSYLICFAAGEFVRYDDGEFDDGEKSIPVAYFCSPQHTPQDLERSFGRTKQMLAWMTQKFAAPFPFPKYYQWAAPGVSGAMENISLVSWDERLVIDERLAAEWTYLLDAINVHEMAHSYFGDAVVCRDFAHAWLKESWATYIEQVWREDAFSAEEGQYVYFDNARAYMIEADSRYKRAIVNRHFRSSWDMYDRHLYPGGACRLHMLRCELGNDIFWPAVQDYLRRFNGQVVETDDFRLVMEQHSGRSLGHFFDQWFYTPGYPQLKVAFRYEADKQQGVLEIEQTQVDVDAGIPAFTFQTSVGWVVDGDTHIHPLRIDQARQVCAVPMAKMPEQVRFDPRCEVLHKLDFNPGDDLLRRQMTDAPDALGRIHAAGELAKTGRYANIEAITAAYRQESFWGVRCEMARVLGEANTEAGLAGIVALLATEQDPMVLPDLLAAAGQYRDERVREAVRARLDSALGYIAAETAYVTLGAQREQAPLDMLLSAARQPSFNGIVQGGALRGLAASRRPEAVDMLLQSVRFGATSIYVRPSAVAALAEIGKGLELRERERVVDTLVDLLRDPHYRIALAAVRGLGVMGTPEAIPALEAFARSRATQEAAVAERVIASLRSQDKVDGSALQKQLDTLSDRLRKIEDQVQRLQA